MSSKLREVENVRVADKLDEVDMAMYRVLLNDQKNTQQMVQQAQQAVLKVQGSEEFLVKLWREKYHIEGSFNVDEKGSIKRLPTAEVVTE